MKIAIHQPEFMPWPGFFYKMAVADIYVVLDHVQFKKGYFENRNRIVSRKKKVTYIIAPVKTKGRYPQSIRDVEIDNNQAWKDALLKKIRYTYSRAPCFAPTYDLLADTVMRRDHARLIDFNLDIIGFFREQLHIPTPMQYSSQLNVHSCKGSDLVLQICLQTGADTYLSGPSGKDYLDIAEFVRHGIQVEWLDFTPPVYRQAGEGFTPGMSTLDLLFNHGEESLRILMNDHKK